MSLCAWYEPTIVHRRLLFSGQCMVYMHLRVLPRVLHFLLPRAPFSELSYTTDTAEVCSENKMEEDFHPELRPFVLSDVQLTGTTIAPVCMCVCVCVCVCACAYLHRSLHKLILYPLLLYM